MMVCGIGLDEGHVNNRTTRRVVEASLSKPAVGFDHPGLVRALGGEGESAT